MKLTPFLFAALALATVGSTVARADTFSFSFGTAGVDPFNGSGFLIGSNIAPNEFQITSVTGTTNTGNGTNRVIAGIAPVGTFEINDNILFTTAGLPSFSYKGLSYVLANGAMVNLFDTNGEILQRTSGAIVSETLPVNITAVTPEPSSMLLLGTGMLGTLGVLRRRLMA